MFGVRMVGGWLFVGKKEKRDNVYQVPGTVGVRVCIAVLASERLREKMSSAKVEIGSIQRITS